MKKLITLTTIALLAGVGFAIAKPMTSGRPSAVLNSAQCKDVWSLTERRGDTLSADKATPFIVNWHIADVNGDGQLSWHEFKKACGKGLVSNPNSRKTG
jgi:hypothetical protein